MNINLKNHIIDNGRSRFYKFQISTIIQGEPKKCDLRRLVQNCTLLCNSSVWYFFNIF